MLYLIPRNHTIRIDRSKNSKYEYVTARDYAVIEKINLSICKNRNMIYF